MNMNKIPGIVSVFFLILFMQCALMATRNIEVSEEQKEEDLIELLNAQQQIQNNESQTYGNLDDLNNQLTKLKQVNLTLNEENNLLKSDMMMLNERIRQIENELQSNTNESIEMRQAGSVLSRDNAPSKKPVASNRSMTSFEIEYQQAMTAYQNRNYRDALSRFSSVLSTNRNHALSDNCQYWVGECYFALKDYNQAIIAFEKVFTFLKSNKDDDAQFKLGYTYFKLCDTNRAQEEFNRLITNYTKSEYVPRAQSYLNRLQ